jgi:hypothetical protein
MIYYLIGSFLVGVVVGFILTSAFIKVMDDIFNDRKPDGL